MSIDYYGITTHNLQNLTFQINEDSIVVLKGVSGSGKSSLAIDTIYQISEDELSQITSSSEKRSFYTINDYKNILPALCLRQENYNINPRSTIGTYSGINLYFQNLFAYANSISRELLRFNNPEVACRECLGIGTILTPSLNNIIDIFSPFSVKSFRIWSGKLSDFYQKLLQEFCADNSIRMSVPFCDLPEEQKTKLLYGKSDEKYTIKYSSAGIKHTKTSYYIGALSYAQDLLIKHNITESQKQFFAVYIITQKRCPVLV